MDHTAAVADTMAAAQRSVEKYQRGANDAARAAGRAGQLDDH
jgi:hypothetical protein